MKKKVVIIGAGPAGLCAAYELLKDADEKYDVTVLEESDTLGGISRTVRYNGNRMDIGGHRFFSKDDDIMKWWQDMLPIQGFPSYDDKVLGKKRAWEKGGPDPERDDEVMLIRERVSRIYYHHTFFDYPVSLSLKTIRGMGIFTTIRAGLSYIFACVCKRDETNLENFYINRFGKVLYSMFFEGYTQKLWGRHPRDISADWGAQRVKGLSITAVLKDMFGKVFGIKKRKVETSLIEEYLYPKYGPGQLWELVGKKVTDMGGKILYHHKVKKIYASDGHISKLVCDGPDEETDIKGDIFLSSMPVKDLVMGIDDKDLDPRIYKACKKLPYRDFVTVGLLVDKLLLANETDIKTLGNIIPDCWIYVQDKGVKLGRIQIFNNWSPYMVKDPATSVWIGLEYFCDEGDDFWNMSDDECIHFATNELIKMGVISKDVVKDAHIERVKKAYPAYFDTYKYMDRIIKALNKYDNLYCIGRNGQHRYNNMDHSMATAITAVKVIKSGDSDKSAIWNVNTESEYHEEK